MESKQHVEEGPGNERTGKRTDNERRGGRGRGQVKKGQGGGGEDR